MKKTLSAILCAMLLCTSAAQSGVLAASDGVVEGTYSDWAQEELEEADELGLNIFEDQAEEEAEEAAEEEEGVSDGSEGQDQDPETPKYFYGNLPTYDDIPPEYMHYYRGPSVVTRLYGSSYADPQDLDYTKSITRIDFCRLAVKLYSLITGDDEPTAASHSFADIENAKQNKYVAQAYGLGIVKGYSETVFAPENSITRQEICTMLTRCITAATLKTGHGIKPTLFPNVSFPDIGEVADWARSGVLFSVNYNIMNGVAKNGQSFIEPLGLTTNEQAMILVKRVYDNRNDFFA